MKLFSFSEGIKSREFPKAHQGKLMGRRITGRYARKGTIHSNQGFFHVGRDEYGKFVSNGK